MSAFDGAYWEDRYRRGEATSRGHVSPSLVAEVADLPPGRALDAGCGRGADAVWLAERGWQVTALDVSATAVERARASAAEAGVADRVTWVHGDLLTWEPDEPYDLVTSAYVHVPGPAEALSARLASWVAPGGTLHVVGHAHGGHGTHAHPDGAQVGTDQVTSVLGEGWEVVTAEPRTHVLPRPEGDVVLSDVVVRARRR